MYFKISDTNRGKKNFTYIVAVHKQEVQRSFKNRSVMSTIYEPRPEKTNILVSDLVPHKPGCTATEDGLRLEISDLESRGIVLSM